MRPWLFLAMAGLSSLPWVALGQTAGTNSPVVADVLKLSREMVDEEIIVAFVKNSAGASLTAQEIIDLQSLGISSRVLVALMTARQNPVASETAATNAPSTGPSEPSKMAPPADTTPATAISTTTEYVSQTYVDFSGYAPTAGLNLTDFGTARLPEGSRTRSEVLLGTPAYMAPERIERADSADIRSDLYALGAVGCFLLTGKAPFDGESDLALAYRVVHTPAPLASSAADAVPDELDRLIARCLAKSAEQRPASAAEVAAELDRLLVAAPWTNLQAREWWEAHVTRYAPAAGGAGGKSS